MIKKLIKKFVPKVNEYKYDNLYSSRSVIKNQYINTNINTNALGGYYNEDIWGVVNKELEGKIEQGISLYGEIVGFLQSGKEIQKGYSYGCKQYLSSRELGLLASNHEAGEHKFLVYRITYTKPDGNVIEFTWNQIKSYCAKYGIETVKELYYGHAQMWIGPKEPDNSWEGWNDRFFNSLVDNFLEKDCPYNPKGTPAEGIVVRIDGKDTYSAYKLKSKRFLEKESKQLDEDTKKGEVNIEES